MPPPTWSSVTPPTPWHGAGTRVVTADGRVFARTEGTLEGGRALVLLHGFPTSSWDYASVMLRLAGPLPVVAMDFLGSGLSDKPPTFPYGVSDQADVLLQVLRHFELRHVHLVAHDGAASVVAEILARRARGLLRLSVESVVFAAGTPLSPVRPTGLAEWVAPAAPRRALFAKPTSFLAFRKEMRRLFVYPDTVSDAELRVSFDLLAREHGMLRWDKLAAAPQERELHAARWSSALLRADLPALCLFGDKDPLAPVAVGERLVSGMTRARLRVLRDVGHFPHIETPDVFAAEIRAFVESVSA